MRLFNINLDLGIFKIGKNENRRACLLAEASTLYCCALPWRRDTDTNRQGLPVLHIWSNQNGTECPSAKY